MRFLLMSLFLIISGQDLYADSTSPTPSGSTSLPSSASPGMKSANPNAVKVIDEGFFDSKKEENLPVSNSTGRYYADDPDYNTEQRAQWLETCAAKKERDPEGYRQCFNDEKKKTRTGIKQKRDSVEKLQAEPLRNANPLLEEQKRNYLPDTED